MSEDELSDGTLSYDICDTRPVSIVDAAKRILASIFRLSLERVAGRWTSPYQCEFTSVAKCYARNGFMCDVAPQT